MIKLTAWNRKENMQDLRVSLKLPVLWDVLLCWLLNNYCKFLPIDSITSKERLKYCYFYFHQLQQSFIVFITYFIPSCGSPSSVANVYLKHKYLRNEYLEFVTLQILQYYFNLTVAWNCKYLILPCMLLILTTFILWSHRTWCTNCC
jgi:hypothetical protein